MAAERRRQKMGVRVGMDYSYAGRFFHSSDVADDPPWRDVSNDWEVRLLNFRLIQPTGPNECRW